jgi:endoglucanase
MASVHRIRPARARASTLAYALATLTGLAACSGGGGGSGAAAPIAGGGATPAPAPAPAPVPVSASSYAACAAAYKPPVPQSAGGLPFCAALSTVPDANGAGSENGQACRVRRAVDIVAGMGQGWNLGNSLDANGNTAAPLLDETYWGNPKTTQALVDAVRKAGFTTLRMPVSWDDHMSGAARTIDPAWMDRVEQVADYALADGMTVILNIHHNGGWEAPTLANEANAKDTLTKLWTQIATRFAKYDHRLVFEAMNEPRVSVNGVDDWVGKAEYYDVINRLDAAALAAIRATGGNNARRLVMLPSYAAAPGEQQLAPLVLPADPMIALSSHAYQPYDFAQNQQGTAVFTDTQTLDALFARLNTRFVAKGIPVVLGEWASTDKNNPLERVKHAAYFVKGAHALGIPTVWWDNGSKTLAPGGTDVMALLDRSTLSWVHQDIVDAVFCSAQ